MELLRPAVNIHQQEIVEKQVLNEAVAVIALLQRADQSLDLECGHLADDKSVVAAALNDKDKLQHLFIKNLEKQKIAPALGIRRRLSEFRHERSCLRKNRRRNCLLTSFRIHHPKLDLRNSLDPIDRAL